MRRNFGDTLAVTDSAACAKPFQAHASDCWPKKLVFPFLLFATIINLSRHDARAFHQSAMLFSLKEFSQKLCYGNVFAYTSQGNLKKVGLPYPKHRQLILQQNFFRRREGLKVGPMPRQTTTMNIESFFEARFFLCRGGFRRKTRRIHRFGPTGPMLHIRPTANLH